jgi:hypothetical protein
MPSEVSTSAAPPVGLADGQPPRITQGRALVLGRLLEHALRFRAEPHEQLFATYRDAS